MKRETARGGRLDSSLISSVPLVSCDNPSGYPCYLRRADQWSIDVLHSFLAAGLEQTVGLFIDEESKGGESSLFIRHLDPPWRTLQSSAYSDKIELWLPRSLVWGRLQ